MTNWHEYVSTAKNANFLHDQDFIQIICQTYGVESLHRTVTSNAGETGVPMFAVKNSVFGKKITSHPFNFYPETLGINDEVAALTEMINEARFRGKKWYVEYKSLNEIDVDSVEVGSPVLRISPVVDSLLELKPSYEEQFKGFRTRLRRYLSTMPKKTEAAGISFRKANSTADVRGFYDVLARLYRNKHRMIPHPESLYQSIFKNFCQKGKGDFYLAIDGGKVIAGGLLLRSKHHHECCWSACDEKYSNFFMLPQVHNQMIQDAIQDNANTFGFGASSPTDSSLQFYKSGWGTTTRPVYYYYWNSQPKNVDMEEGASWIRPLFRCVPLWLIKRSSPFLVPWLA